ncbi:MAG: serine/threonine-protein kinase [Candidatus Krumholzibacteria bacterium]|nr:serine/threonine-protein kinase [Candidatus Krumholzibacteria bacterium]MDH4338389.1 serine/threonine-protein kinase [Candidatus Krumholzibacteria bacterium]
MSATLVPGTRLGPYEILSPLGAGGMGEVYRARDTRLGRDVAVKVLPQHLSSNAEVRARFEREAKTVSSLNHPHICTLFDVGREGDTDYLVMELIEGETLTERLAKGPMPMPDVLRIGTEIADALDRAHRAGIVHRDLKPGNVMLTRSGSKLMDFGLARATGLAGSSESGATIAGLTQSPTAAHPLTAEGTIIGTFQYMSPEQLEGKEADARSDIWALGCVLYEMATGRRAFDGKSQASLITSIMGSQPAPISQVAPLTPPALDRLIGACLVKDAADRIQSAHDVKLQLAWVTEGGSQAGIPKIVTKKRRSRGRLGWVLAVALALVAGVLGRQLTLRAPVSDTVTRTTIAAPAGTRLEVTGDDSGPPALSPDGTMLVFSAVGGGAGKRLWLRRLDEFTPHPLPGTDEASYPFWSPDSKSIAFFGPTKLKRFDLEQNSVITLTDSVDTARGGTWSRDGVIVFARAFSGPLYRVAATGGPLTAVTTLDTTTATTHRFPCVMPDAKHVIYLSALHTDAEGSSSGIYWASVDGSEQRRLFACKSDAIYSQGYLLFVRDSTLMAQEFDPVRGELKGSPRATREVVQIDGSTWKAPITTSDNGILVYGFGGSTGTNRVSWYDRSGVRLKNLTGFGNYLNLDLSPDGRRVAVEWQQLPLADIWIIDRVTGTKSRISTDPSDETQPVWLPDGRELLYSALRGGRYRVFTVRADGSGAERQILENPDHDMWVISVSPDGRWLLCGIGNASGTPHGSLNIAPISGATPPRVLVPESDNFVGAQFSPDGRWIAFSAGVSGRSEVYVSPMPAAGQGLSARWQVSGGGGDRPRWRGDGKELFYVRPDGMIMAASVDGSGGEFHLAGEKALFQVFQRIITQTMDVTADGQNFVIDALGGDEAVPLAVVNNWVATLGQR